MRIICCAAMLAGLVTGASANEALFVRENSDRSGPSFVVSPGYWTQLDVGSGRKILARVCDIAPSSALCERNK